VINFVMPQIFTFGTSLLLTLMAV